MTAVLEITEDDYDTVALVLIELQGSKDNDDLLQRLDMLQRRMNAAMVNHPTGVFQTVSDLVRPPARAEDMPSLLGSGG